VAVPYAVKADSGANLTTPAFPKLESRTALGETALVACVALDATKAEASATAVTARLT
jgi:hypothetical protein